MTPEWTCLDFESRWSEYREGALTAPEAAAARRHAADCERCAALHTALAATLDALGDLPPAEPPERWYASVLTRTSGVRRATRTTWMRAALSPRFAMGLAMTVLAFSLAVNNAAAGPQGLRWESFTPRTVADNAQREAGRLRARAVAWVNDIKLVYEIESAVHSAPPAPGGHSQRVAPPRGPQAA